MPHIEMAGLSRKERFRLISGSVQPRPIALVTTLNSDGTCNAAPFSAFNYMSDEPPIAALGIDRYGDESQGREGEIKDTLRNVLERGEFVINMVDIGMLPVAVGCATDFPAGESEIAALGLDIEASRLVGVPRLAAAPVAWECRKHSVIDIGPARSILLGEILAMHFRPGVLDEGSLTVKADQFQPIGRLGGPNYATMGAPITLPIKPFRP